MQLHPIERLDKRGLQHFGLLSGTIVAVLFGVILPLITGHGWPHWPWIVAGVLWLWAGLVPSTLNPVYQVWMRIGLVLGWINTRLILGLIFYLMVTPIGVVMWLCKRDPMVRKLDDGAKTYRIQSQLTERDRMEKPY